MIKEVMHEIFHTIMRINPTLDAGLIHDLLFDKLIVGQFEDALDLVFEMVVYVNERND